MAEYQPLDAEARDTLEGVVHSIYLDGACYEFAIALSASLDWPLVGFRTQGVIRHALVRHPDGGFWDARGFVDETEVGAPFGVPNPLIEEITVADIRTIRPVMDEALPGALWKAQALWPDLPWKTGTLVQMRRFIEDFEKLCRKHGVAIYAPFETAWPVITNAEGDETVVFTPAANSGSYLFNRRIDPMK